MISLLLIDTHVQLLFLLKFSGFTIPSTGRIYGFVTGPLHLFTYTPDLILETYFFPRNFSCLRNLTERSIMNVTIDVKHTFGFGIHKNSTKKHCLPKIHLTWNLWINFLLGKIREISTRYGKRNTKRLLDAHTSTIFYK